MILLFDHPDVAGMDIVARCIARQLTFAKYDNTYGYFLTLKFSNRIAARVQFSSVHAQFSIVLFQKISASMMWQWRPTSPCAFHNLTILRLHCKDTNMVSCQLWSSASSPKGENITAILTLLQHATQKFQFDHRLNLLRSLFPILSHESAQRILLLYKKLVDCQAGEALFEFQFLYVGNMELSFLQVIWGLFSSTATIWILSAAHPYYPHPYQCYLPPQHRYQPQHGAARPQNRSQNGKWVSSCQPSWYPRAFSWLMQHYNE